MGCWCTSLTTSHRSPRVPRKARLCLAGENGCAVGRPGYAGIGTGTALWQEFLWGFCLVAFSGAWPLFSHQVAQIGLELLTLLCQPPRVLRLWACTTTPHSIGRILKLASLENSAFTGVKKTTGELGLPDRRQRVATVTGPEKPESLGSRPEAPYNPSMAPSFGVLYVQVQGLQTPSRYLAAAHQQPSFRDRSLREILYPWL